MKFGDNKYLWAIRDTRNSELVLLVSSKHSMPGKAVFKVVCDILRNDPDSELRSVVSGSFDKIAFTGAEWETWHVFNLAPAIEIYVDSDELGNAVWKWKSIKA